MENVILKESLTEKGLTNKEKFKMTDRAIKNVKNGKTSGKLEKGVFFKLIKNTLILL